MPRRRFFDEYTLLLDFSAGRQEAFGRKRSIELDFSRLPFCECGQEFLGWARERFPDLLASPTPHELDQALFSIAKEYAHRRRFITPHPLNTCLQEVFEELSETIRDKRDELQRHPVGGGFGAKLFIGDDDDEAEETA